MTATAAEVWATLTPPAPSTDQLVKRDRWGRYVIPHPHTGEVRSWTRATTLASTLADHHGLEQWAKRNVVLGIGARRDLYTAAVACTPDDKQTLNDIVRQAEAVAKASAGANQGTALHRLTERHDTGEPLSIPDPALASDVQAYHQAMTAAGIRVAKDAGTQKAWIERVLVTPDADAAGTCDRICLAPDWPAPRIADLKTGKDVIRYGMTEIALQLAIYAHATHWYDPATGQLHPMPPVDQDTALVMHLPVGQATCTLIEVDIAAGWEAVQLAVAVREWRKRKDLAQIINSPAPPVTTVGAADDSSGGAAQVAHATPPPAATTTLLDRRTTWLRQRVTAIIDAGHEPDLAERWPPGMPTLRQGGLTDEQVTAVADACGEVEDLFHLPFGPADPAYGNRRASSDEPQHISEPLAQAVEQMAAASPPPDPTAEELAAKARELLDQFDPDERVAVAECALPEGRYSPMAADRFVRLMAVVTELIDPVGAVQFAYGAHTARVAPSDQAIDRMVAATGGGRTHALTRAKRLARHLDQPVPRSLAQAAENPLLAALVAAGMGTATNDQQEGSNQP